MPEQQSLIFRSHFTSRSVARRGYDLNATNSAIPKRAGLYLIVHEGSDKLYVGSATDLCRRHGEHQRMLRRGDHENGHLQKAWNAHGANSFSFLILFYCSPSDLLFYEQRTLDFYKARLGWRLMYNSNPTAASRLGSPKSAEERAKISARMKGNQYTKGRKLSEEHKAKIVASLMGNSRRRGIPHSEESKKKMAARRAIYLARRREEQAANGL